MIRAPVLHSPVFTPTTNRTFHAKPFGFIFDKILDKFIGKVNDYNWIEK